MVLRTGVRVGLGAPLPTEPEHRCRSEGAVPGLIGQRTTDAAEGAAVLGSYLVTSSETAAHAYANRRSLARARVVIRRG